MRRTLLGAGLRLILFAVLGTLFVVGLTGCGCCSDEPTDLWGNVFVDNLTDQSTVEEIWFFQIAPVDQPWTGNLLSGPLPAGSTEFVGTFHEDYYDAYAELELGGTVEWGEIFVGYGEDVFFEVY